MTASTTGTGQRTGLFIGSWEIGTMVPGAPLLTVHLTFSAPTAACTGLGHVTQAVNPPMDIPTRLDGDYTYLTVMPDTSHILVTLTGTPVLQWPAGGGLGPVLLPNARLRMVLDADWQRGTATFAYLASNGTWNTVESATAQMSGSVNTAGRP